MKYTITRCGTYSYTETSDIQQTVEVEADSEEEAIDRALDPNDDVDDVIKEDSGWVEWGDCDDGTQRIVGPILSEEYYTRCQLAASARVFKDNGELA